MIDFYVAIDKLKQFEVADEIALFFDHEGIKGYRSHAAQCPIAQWVKATTGKKNVTAFHASISVWDDDTAPVSTGPGSWMFSGQESAATSPAMRTFMENFDNGLYPDLTLGDAGDCTTESLAAGEANPESGS